MTNSEKYKTAEERDNAFSHFCDVVKHKCKVCPCSNNNYRCAFAWLDLEAEEEKPMPCPFCGRKCVCVIDEHESFVIRCTNCDYTYGNAMDKDKTIQVHNDMCKAVAASPIRRGGIMKDSVCHDCAKKMGYEPDDKCVVVWVANCDFCGKHKPLTSLSNDWHKKEVNNV